MSNENSIHEEIKCRLKAGNSCYYSVSALLKIKIYKTVMLPVVLYGCETWSLTYRKEHSLRLLANRIIWGIFRPKRD